MTVVPYTLGRVFQKRPCLAGRRREQWPVRIRARVTYKNRCTIENITTKIKYGRPAGRNSSSSGTNRVGRPHTAGHARIQPRVREVKNTTCPRLPSYVPAPRVGECERKMMGWWGGRGRAADLWTEKFRPGVGVLYWKTHIYTTKATSRSRTCCNLRDWDTTTWWYNDVTRDKPVTYIHTHTHTCIRYTTERSCPRVARIRRASYNTYIYLCIYIYIANVSTVVSGIVKNPR